MNKPYPKGKEHFAIGGINWAADTIKVAVLTTAYTYSAAHEFVSSLTGIVGRSAALSSKTYTGGVLSSAAALFAAQTGSQFFYAVVYKDTGADGTSPLLYYIDTATNLPTTPNGIDVTIVPDPTGRWFPL